MRDNNICKFVPPTFSTTLFISCFVKESNQDVMLKGTNLLEHRLVLFTKGEGRVNLDKSILHFEPGSVIFCFKGESFSVEPIEETEYLYIHFSGNRAEELFSRFGVSHQSRVFNGFDSIIPLWKESLSRATKETIDIAAESVLLHTFLRLSTTHNEKNDLLDKIIKLTDEHFNLPELSIGEIAKELSYNSKYLSSLFKEKMGVSYSEYLRTLRIKYAVSLFDNGIESVKNVALLSGYTDPLYFSTVFKKEMGVSPKEYKRNPKS